MRNYADIAIRVDPILLPKAGIDLYQWAVIACDQFTSQPEYWREVEEIVGNAPSALHMILPEVYLNTDQEAARVQRSQAIMRQYLTDELLVPHEGMIYVERSVDGKTRHGVMLALDLEQYDYRTGSQSLIRATEGTIIERLPPRIRIREGAALELPHILVLIDDPEGTVIEPLARASDRLTPLYETELMLGSGTVRGSFIDEAEEARIVAALRRLAEPQRFQQHYGVGSDQGVLLFAMGDGNHSLATAKAIWEKVKNEVGPDHPARYALVEVENVHDSGLVFEPIHRVIFGANSRWREELDAFFHGSVRYHTIERREALVEAVNGQPETEQSLGIVTPEGLLLATFDQPASNLPVGTIQKFLDGWLKDSGAREIDYVHGSEVVFRLGSQPGNLGILLPPMPKADLFRTVLLDGVLPRKTFSMGEAHEKRFYVESRKIVAK